ncbi:SEC12-like protein 2 isoform X1 [Ananas comosus]|uniref:SEC12-like protein 2 isoform X1 n=1 Tax=Ananas comosus TaxID=4615 RepID=A0A6P5G3S3_ANACO|nr:SEC12-like protein 2 isoform X1 [Ananas comosus]
MAKGRREIPPCSKTYGFPIYCASFVPLAEIAAAKKDDEDDGAADAPGGGDGGGGSGEGGGGGGGGDRLVAALGGGGGEGRSGVPNALVVACFDLPSRSLSDQPVFRMGTNADVPYRMAVHPKGDGIICSFPKSCRWFEWDLLEGKELHNLALKSSGKILQPLEDVGLQLALSFNEEGSLLATGGEDGRLRVFKWPSMESILEESVDNTTLKDLDFSSNGKFLACLRSSGPCRVWDLTSVAVVANLPREDGEIFGFCRFSHGADDNQILYVTAMHGDKGRIVSWNISSWNRIGSKSIARDPISAFNVSSDAICTIYSGTVEGSIIILRSADTQVHTAVKKAHLGIVTALVFSQDTRALLSSSFDSTARVTVIENKKSKGLNMWLILLVIVLAIVAYHMRFKAAP